MDDIKEDNLTNLEEMPPKPQNPSSPKEVGPESEVRGGPEAPTE